MKQILTLAVAIVAIYWGWKLIPFTAWSVHVSEFAKSQGTKGMVIFVVIYVLATLVLFPTAFLTFAAGVAYGFYGFPLVLVATLSGASLAFAVSRHFIKDRVESYMNKRPSTQAIKSAVEAEGWKFMLLLRISPVIPFNVNNYFLGTVRVGFFSYIAMTFVGSIPGTVLFLYMGSIGQNFEQQNIWRWVLLGVGLIATVALTKITMKKINEMLPVENPT
jgi:uncharacterized membrane protein YdjX (TVP38/TMEM64 family)